MPAALSTAAAGTGASSSGEAAQGESSGKENSQAHGDEGLGFSSTMARAWANATGSSFARGLADGSAARQDQQRQRNLSARVEEQQHAAEQRRAESLARETGASSSDDIESIASNITSPPAGHNREQMIRAYRDSAGLLREMAQTYGGPARAAAVAGYRNFAELAKALVDERLQQGQIAERSSQESTAPTDSNVNSEQSDEASAPTTSQTDEGLNVRSDQTAAAAQAENAISVSAKSGETLASSLTALPSPGAVTQPPSELGAAASQPHDTPLE